MATPLLTGLVEYWGLEEPSGNFVGVNSTALARAGGAAAPGSGPGKLGNGATFVAANSQRADTSGNVASMSPGSGSFTLCGWFNATTLGADRGIVCKWGGSSALNEWLLRYRVASTKFSFAVGDGAGATATAESAGSGTVTTGGWYLVVAWLDTSTQKVNIQVNNGAIVSASCTFAVVQSTRAPGIGNVSGGSPMDGTLDAIGYWNRVLTAGERDMLWNNGSGLEYPWSPRPVATTSSLLTNLVDYFKLDEASGNRVGVKGTLLAPANAPGNTAGKLSSAAAFVAASSQRLTLSPVDTSAFAPGMGSFTIACWVNTNSFPGSGRRSIFCKELNGGAEWGLRIVPSGYQWFISADSGGSTFSAQTATTTITGQWTLLVAGFDAVNQKIFISLNGKAATRAAANAAFASSGVFVSGANLNVGAENSSTNATGQNFWDGSIGSAGYWSKTLTDGEIALLWNNGNGLEYPFTRGLVTTTQPRVVAATSSLLTGLTDYWRLEEASGNRVGVSGTVLAPTNAPGNAAGKLGSGLSLVAASTQNLTLSPLDATKFTPGMGSFTVCAWAKVGTGGADRPVLSKYNGNNGQNDWVLYWINAGGPKWRFLLTADTATTKLALATDPPVVSTGQWYFLVGWFDAATQTANLQVNNRPVASGAADAQFAISGVFQGTSSLRIGQYSAGTFGDGVIDGVGYWSRVLTAGERALLWSNGNGLEYPFGRGQLTTTTLRSAA